MVRAIFVLEDRIKFEEKRQCGIPFILNQTPLNLNNICFASPPPLRDIPNRCADIIAPRVKSVGVLFQLWSPVAVPVCGGVFVSCNPSRASDAADSIGPHTRRF